MNIVSFRIKLVCYFVLLTLLPVGAALWGLDALAKRSETRTADVRLQAGLGAALARYGSEVAAAERGARELARYRPFQRALGTRDRRALAEFARAHARVQIRAPRLAIGPEPPADAVVRTARVVVGGRSVGEVRRWFRLDRGFLGAAKAAAGLGAADALVVVRDRRVAVGPREVAGSVLATQGPSPAVRRLGGARYRVLVATSLPHGGGRALAVVTPEREIAAAARRSSRRVVAALAAAVVVAGLVAYVLSRSIVHALAGLARAAEGIAAGRRGERVPVRGGDEFGQLARAFNAMAAQLEGRLADLEAERTRLHRATGRIGDALAATHDAEQLLAIVVETAVEATGADGGFVRVADGSHQAEVGESAPGADVIEVPLRAGRRSFGTLVLSGGSFGSDDRETAASLVAQAVVALENARLHQMVERQALVDALTGLANRRSAEETLRAELARAERLGGDVAVVLADLDGFKDVNDRHGHPSGDVVLREFARRLRHTVRGIDLAARWGGEEFCLVLPGTDAHGAAQVADRARVALEKRPISLPDGTTLHVTASFGVASLADHGSDGDVVAAADAALYEAKRTGKNRVVVAEQVSHV